MVKSKKNKPKESIGNQFINFIKPYTQNEVTLNVEQTFNMTHYYIDDGKGHKGNGVHGHSVPTVSLKNGFFLYAAVSFEHDHNPKDDIFEGITLQFFNENELLFRAELNRLTNKQVVDNPLPHPQPHWHFNVSLNTKRKETVIQGSDFVEFNKQANRFNNNILKQDTLSDMHFTMNYDDAYLKEDFDKVWTKDKITYWIIKTLDTTFRELDFMKIKLGI